MFFDSHAHVNDKQFDHDREVFLATLEENEIIGFAEISYDIQSSKKAMELAMANKNVYAVVGVHPADADSICTGDMAILENMTKNDKVVAIGEIGLDYHFEDSPSREEQKLRFCEQLDLARSLDMPVVIHSRDAMEDTIKILKDIKVNGIIHCFSGSVESAKILLDMGFFISVAGPLTFKNARNLPEVVKYVPNDRILIETDSPYMAPEPYRGKRNCPIYVKEVCRKMAEIKGMPIEKMAEITLKNAKTVYRINNM